MMVLPIQPVCGPTDKTWELNSMRRLQSVVFIAIFSLVSVVGSAKKPGAYKKEFERWAGTIGRLSTQDKDKLMVKEIELIRSLVSQGHAHMAQDNLDEIDSLLQRAEALSLFVKAKLKRLDLERKADDADAAATAAEQRAEAAKSQADATKARFEALESQGL